LGATDASAMFAGAPGRTIFTVNGTSATLDQSGGPVLFGLSFAGKGTAVAVSGTDGVLIKQCTFNANAGVQALSGALSHNLHITDCTFDNGLIGVDLSKVTSAQIASNTFEYLTIACRLSGQAGQPLNADVHANTITQCATGIEAGEDLVGSRIRENSVFHCTVGFLVASGVSTEDNLVFQNTTGMEYNGTLPLLGNQVFDNETGLSGSGLLGTTGWHQRSNRIYNNLSGVRALSGATVQFNRLHDNETGVRGASASTIAHNLIYCSTGHAIHCAKAEGCILSHNTIHSPLGGGIRIEDFSSNVAIHDNIVWVSSGIALYLSTDSQAGLSSDFNNWYADGSGTLAWRQHPFTDLVDWQYVTQLDLNSIGTTAGQPTLDAPVFLDLIGEDYHLSPSSTSLDAGQTGGDIIEEPAPNGGRRNLGAYGGTSAATTSNSSFLRLQYPEYYTDWLPGQGNLIRWESDNLGGNVDIDLMLVGGGKIADIAVVPVIDGSVVWAPQQSGITTGNVSDRYRIRITSVTQPALQEESREGFSIPPLTTIYYVNDTSEAQDEYTTAAGSNRNTGTSPADPKADLPSILRAYTLGTGDLILLDHGTYVLAEDLKITATLGIGDDQGFTLRGPVQNDHRATLNRASTFGRVIEFDDADQVTVEHVHLTGGAYGAWVRNNASQITLRQVECSENSIGIYLDSAVSPTIESCNLHNNSYAGLNIRFGVNLTIHRSHVHHNGTGILAMGRDQGAYYTIGDATLSNANGNFIYDNIRTGISADWNVNVAGNAIYQNDQVGLILKNHAEARYNLIYLNGHGAEMQGDRTCTLVNNRIYANEGCAGSAEFGLIANNVVYSNRAGGFYIIGSATLKNNLIYANPYNGILIDRDTDRAVYVDNNTFVQLGGNALQIESEYQLVRARNNVFVSYGGRAIKAATTGEPRLISDYNLFHRPGGKLGTWQGVQYDDLATWRTGSGLDQNSFEADPLFVDEDGADDVLGYDGPAEGMDDDMHLQSMIGSFHGDALAPVINANGLPVWPVGTEVNDAALSPGLDRGDPSFDFSNEPPSNGGYINLGVYGNTTQASRSPARYLTLLAPQANEIWPEGQTFPIKWRSHDINDTIVIDLLRSGNPPLSLASGETNDGLFDWTVPGGLTPATNYQIRVTRSDAPPLIATSGFFSITNAISMYYVNDGSVNGSGDWCTAPGNDANSGLSPGAPKASIQAILDSYELGSGDILLVDAGTYNITDRIFIGEQDAGLRMKGYKEAAFPTRHATIRRNSSSSGAYAIYMTNADNTILEDLRVTRAYIGIRPHGDNVQIERCEVFGNAEAGIEAGLGEGSVIRDCVLYGIPGGASSDDQPKGLIGSVDLSVVQNNLAYDTERGFDLKLGSGSHFFANTARDCSSVGFDLEGYRFSNDFSVIENNRATDCDAGLGVKYAIATGNSVSNCTSNGIFVNDRGRLFNNRVVGCGGSGIYVAGTDILVQNNRSCGNGDSGLILRSTINDVRIINNHLYSNRYGLRTLQLSSVNSSHFLIRNNFIYDNREESVLLTRTGHPTRSTLNFRNNTLLHDNPSDAIRLQWGATNVKMRNNLIFASQGNALFLSSDSLPGFSSDYTLFALGTNTTVAQIEETVFQELDDWRLQAVQDQHSLIADPQMIDPLGPDGILGYHTNSMTDLSLDNDFHVMPGAPGTDQGDPDSPFHEERIPNGNRVNIGAYGNSQGADQSPAQQIQVLSPNGLNKLIEGVPEEMTWMSAGLAPTSIVLQVSSGGLEVDGWTRDEFNQQTFNNIQSNPFGITTIVSHPAPPEIYTRRASMPGGNTEPNWHIPLATGSYLVRIHFIASSISQPGRNVLDIALNGQIVETGFDMANHVHAQYQVVVWSHPVTTSELIGLDITLLTHTGSGPELSGYEIWRVDAPPGGVTYHLEASTDLGTNWVSIATQWPTDLFGQDQYAWSPTPATLDHTALFRVAAESLGITDTSDEGFLISTPGNAYYLNDTNTTDDVYTVAPGDDRNSGRSPLRPMASLASLIDTYDLGPGDTVRVDAGHYPLIRDITIGANDAGTHIIGAAEFGEDSELDRGNRGDDAFAMTLIEANGTTIEGLRFTNAAIAVKIEDSTEVHVKNCTMDGVGIGVRLEGEALENLLVEDCFIRRAETGIEGTSWFYPEHVRLANNTVTNCTNGISMGLGNFSVVAGNQVIDSVFYGLKLEAPNAVSPYQPYAISNHVAHCKYGISASRVHVYSNVVHDSEWSNIDVRYNAKAIGNECYRGGGGISHIIGDATVISNRVYANSFSGIRVEDRATVVGNVIYDNELGIDGSSGDSVYRHNLIYNNTNGAIRIFSTGFNITGLDLSYNTIVQPQGYAISLGVTRDVSIENNIIQYGAGYAFEVDEDSAGKFTSDYNLIHGSGNGGSLARYADVLIQGSTDWRLLTRYDRSSVFADPQFVDPSGPDGTIGYDELVAEDFGRDDDFRLQAASPAVDAGNLVSPVGHEPSPNGGRVNLGVYGGRPDTSPSPQNGLQLLMPMGLEKIVIGDSIYIGWRTYGVTNLPGPPTVDVYGSLNNGFTWTPIASGVSLDANGAGSTTWIPFQETTGHAGLIRIEISSLNLSDQLDSPFLVAPIGNLYYVNDTDTTDDVFTTAPGNNLNHGLSPDQPLSHLRVLLDGYELGAGDRVFMDTGVYMLTDQITISSNDAAVHITGAGQLGGRTVLDRNDSRFGTVMLVDHAPGTVLEHLEFTGADTGLDIIGGHSQRIEYCKAYENDSIGISGSDIRSNLVVRSCETWGIPYQSPLDQDRGIGFARTGTDTLMEYNFCYDSRWGISVGPGERGLFQHNTIHNCREIGISITGTNVFTGTDIPLVQHNDITASTTGLSVSKARAMFNRVSDSLRNGITAGSNSEVTRNISFQNGDHGISASGSEYKVMNNRCFGNQDAGIYLYDSSSASNLISGNMLYDNTWGIDLADSSISPGLRVENNLIYNNQATGIRINNSFGSQTAPLYVVNNTIVQATGSAIALSSQTRRLNVHNNIFDVSGGHALFVPATASTYFESDFNLFHLAPGASTFAGHWAGADQVNLSDWQSASGMDTFSISGDPQFFDPDGADDILGFLDLGGNTFYDGGQDDHFGLQRTSPAIDQGTSTNAPANDLHGQARTDTADAPNTPFGAYHDLGAIEFQGAVSGDLLAPQVASTVPLEIHQGGVLGTTINGIVVQFDEALDPITAENNTAYELLRDSNGDGEFDVEDTRFALNAEAENPSRIHLLIETGYLARGTYRLRILDNRIYDASGNPLNGYQRIFVMADPAGDPPGLSVSMLEPERHIQFDTFTGYTYIVEYDDDLERPPTWQTLPGAPHSNSLFDYEDVKTRYYRIRRVKN
jgi:parallel beta-helix repeat protein